MISLLALIVLVTMAGCYDGERRDVDDRHITVAQPSAATLETCHGMYPKQPDMEQECIRRWTVGGQMSGLPPEPPHGGGLTPEEIVANRAVLAHLDPRDRLSESHLRELTACVDRWKSVMQGARR